MSWLLFILVVAASQGKGLEILINILVFCAALCRPVRRAVCSLHTVLLSSLYRWLCCLRMIRLNSCMKKAKEVGFIWNHLFPLPCWHTSNSGGKLDTKKLRQDCKGLFWWSLHVRVRVSSCMNICNAFERGVSLLEISCR